MAKEKYALGIATIEKHTIEQVVGESGEDILSIERRAARCISGCGSRLQPVESDKRKWDILYRTEIRL